MFVGVRNKEGYSSSGRARAQSWIFHLSGHRGTQGEGERSSASRHACTKKHPQNRWLSAGLKGTVLLLLPLKRGTLVWTRLQERRRNVTEHQQSGTETSLSVNLSASSCSQQMLIDLQRLAWVSTVWVGGWWWCVRQRTRTHTYANP